MALATLANNIAKILFSKNFINKAVKNIFYWKQRECFSWSTIKVRWTFWKVDDRGCSTRNLRCAWKQGSTRTNVSTLSLSKQRLYQLFSRLVVCSWFLSGLTESYLGWLRLQFPMVASFKIFKKNSLNSLMNAARFLLESYSRRISTHPDIFPEFLAR